MTVRKERVGLREVLEEVSVVEAEDVALTRTVRRRPSNRDPVRAQPVKLCAQVGNSIYATDGLKRDEIVVPTDLVSVVVLERPKCMEKPRVATVVGRAVEHEVRRGEITPVLEPPKRDGALEAAIHVMPEPDNGAVA
jgi:hypothetical protein